MKGEHFLKNLAAQWAAKENKTGQGAPKHQSIFASAIYMFFLFKKESTKPPARRRRRFFLGMFREICLVHASNRGGPCFWGGVRTISVCVRQNFCFGMFFCFFPPPHPRPCPPHSYFYDPKGHKVKEEVWKPLKNEPLPSRDHVEDRMLGS